MRRSKTMSVKNKIIESKESKNDIELKNLLEDKLRIENKLRNLDKKMNISIENYKKATSENKLSKKKEASKIFQKVKFYKEYLQNLIEKQDKLEFIKTEEDIVRIKAEVVK